MSFIGAVGTVAQQGNQGAAPSAPTGVSIATTSTGNYDDACLVVILRTGASGENPLTSNDGSDFSSQSATIELAYSTDYTAVLNEHSGLLELVIRGYIRATNALTYAWDTDGLTIVDSNSILDTAGWHWSTAATDQDETTGIVNAVRVYHSSGGRGYNLLSAGDTIAWTVDATATNASGTTAAAQLDVTVEIS